MASGIIDYLFISRQCRCSIARFRGRQRWLLCIAHICISLSLCPSRQTRSIAPGRKKCDREGAARVVNVAERSKRVGRTIWRSYTLATAGENGNDICPRVTVHRAHPRRDPVDVNRSDIDCYSIRVPRYSVPRQSIDNTCNTKRLAHARGNTSSG